MAALLRALTGTLAALVLASCGGEDQTGETTVIPAGTRTGSEGLTHRDRAHAARILAADPALDSLLDQRNSYEVARLGAFSDQRDRLIGAAAVLSLDKPLNGEAKLPGACFSNRGYIPQTVDWKFQDTSKLVVEMDFHSDRVVNFIGGPGVHATSSPPEPQPEACAKVPRED